MGKKAFTVALVVLLLFLAGCEKKPAVNSGAAPLPGAPAEPDRATIRTEPFSIGLFYYQDQSGIQETQAFYDRLQTLLQAAGWNVQIVMTSYSVGNAEETLDDMLPDILKKAVGTGKAADAYFVSPNQADRLLKAQVTQDLSAVVPQAAPVLYESLKPLFAGPVDGMPAAYSTIPKGYPLALHLNTAQLAAYRQPIRNADDVLTYLEQNTDATIVCPLLGQALLDAWAAQKGYYSLFDYGMPSGYYARLDDAACVPVPAEAMDGFAEFFGRMAALQLDDRLIKRASNEQARATGVLGGMVTGVSDFMTWTGLPGSDFTTLPLDGCATPTLPADRPEVLQKLAVMAGSDRADVVAALAQWALTTPRGFYLCNYGQENVEYRLVDGRMELLNAGQPLSPADLDWSTNILPLFRNPLVFFNTAMVPPNVYAASNAAEVLAQNRPVQPPVWRIEELRGRFFYLRTIFDVTIQGYDDMLHRRERILECAAEDDGPSRPTPEELLKQLEALRPDVDEVAVALAYKLADMLEATAD